MSEDSYHENETRRLIAALVFGLMSGLVSVFALATGEGGLPRSTLLVTTVVAFLHSWAGFILGRWYTGAPGARGLVIAGVAGALTPVLALVLYISVLVVLLMVTVTFKVGRVWKLVEGELDNPALTLVPVGDVISRGWIMVLVSAAAGMALRHLLSDPPGKRLP